MWENTEGSIFYPAPKEMSSNVLFKTILKYLVHDLKKNGEKQQIPKLEMLQLENGCHFYSEEKRKKRQITIQQCQKWIVTLVENDSATISMTDNLFLCLGFIYVLKLFSIFQAKMLQNS